MSNALAALPAILPSELPPTYNPGGKNGVYQVDKMELSGKILVDHCSFTHNI